MEYTTVWNVLQFGIYYSLECITILNVLQFGMNYNLEYTTHILVLRESRGWTELFLSGKFDSADMERRVRGTVQAFLLYAALRTSKH